MLSFLTYAEGIEILAKYFRYCIEIRADKVKSSLLIVCFKISLRISCDCFPIMIYRNGIWIIFAKNIVSTDIDPEEI